jgi:hypothetical protein
LRLIDEAVDQIESFAGGRWEEMKNDWLQVFGTSPTTASVRWAAGQVFTRIDQNLAVSILNFCRLGEFYSRYVGGLEAQDQAVVARLSRYRAELEAAGVGVAEGAAVADAPVGSVPRSAWETASGSAGGV